MKYVKVINRDSKYYGYIFKVLEEKNVLFLLEIPKNIPEYKNANPKYDSLPFSVSEVEKVN